MSQPDQSEDKQFEPTQKKLDDARKKGEVARSVDLTTAASYGGFVIVAVALGPTLVLEFGADMRAILARAPELASDMFEGGSRASISGIVGNTARVTLPWFLVPAIAAVLGIAAQRSFTFTLSKIQPKLSRLSLISNAKNKFGRQGVFEFFKSFTKLVTLSVALGFFLLGQMPEIIASPSYQAKAIAGKMAELATSFTKFVFLIVLILGTVDFLWQRAEHLRKNRMSRKELMDELKQAEGDPQLKQQRRQKGQQIAMNQMLADVADADVVIVNPSHFAVALKWNRETDMAPICIAKGVDEVAARIRREAGRSGVPIHRDPPTARSLFATVGIGEEIWPEHYRAVAAAIRFAEEMGRKSRNWRAAPNERPR